MVTQLVKEYNRSQPTVPNHEDTQVDNFKFYSMSLGRTASSGEGTFHTLIFFKGTYINHVLCSDETLSLC